MSRVIKIRIQEHYHGVGGIKNYEWASGSWWGYNDQFLNEEKSKLRPDKGLKYYCKAYGHFYLDNSIITTKIKVHDEDEKFYSIIHNSNNSIYRDNDNIINIKDNNIKASSHIHWAYYIHSYTKTLILSEILKIGTILNGQKAGFAPDIMVVCNGGPVFDYYVDILRDKCGDDYKYLRTDQAIIGKPEVYKGTSSGKFKTENKLVGVMNDEPMVGISFNLEWWHTSTVMRILDESVFLTKNSVYAIHDVSLLREKRLNEINGIDYEFISEENFLKLKELPVIIQDLTDLQKLVPGLSVSAIRPSYIDDQELK